MKITRRQFLGSAIAATAVAACGGDSDSGADAAVSGKNCTTNGTTASIGGNHGHTITVSAADVAAGTAKTYDISGTGGHAHMITVTAAHFTMLQSNPGGNVMVTSTSGGAPSHEHTVTILCA